MSAEDLSAAFCCSTGSSAKKGGRPIRVLKSGESGAAAFRKRSRGGEWRRAPLPRSGTKNITKCDCLSKLGTCVATYFWRKGREKGTLKRVGAGEESYTNMPVWTAVPGPNPLLCPLLGNCLNSHELLDCISLYPHPIYLYRLGRMGNVAQPI